MLYYPANPFDEVLVPHVTLGASQGTKTLKSNFFGSDHRNLE